MQSSALSPQTTLALMQQSSQSSDIDLATMKNSKNIENTAHEFEAVFISEMIKPMFEGIETDTMFGGGKGEEVFRGIMIQEYGKIIADRDVTGIQTQVRNKLIEMQSENSRNATPYINTANNNIIDAEFTETTPPTQTTISEGVQ